MPRRRIAPSLSPMASGCLRRPVPPATAGMASASAPPPGSGYQFPPQWGPDSYNNGAGMTRVLTVAIF